MKNRTHLLIVLLALVITTHSLPSSAGNPDEKTNCSPYVAVDTKSDPNFSFLKQDIKEGVIYKGLPNAMGDSENLEKEKEKPHFQKHTDYFYEESKEIGTPFIKHIRSILKTKNSVCGYPKVGAGGLRPIKFCGGFHADYMITLRTATQKIDIQICYGCGDIKLFLDDVYIDEYDMDTEREFKKWTDPYRNLGSNKEAE